MEEPQSITAAEETSAPRGSIMQQEAKETTEPQNMEAINLDQDEEMMEEETEEGDGEMSMEDEEEMEIDDEEQQMLEEELKRKMEEEEELRVQMEEERVRIEETRKRMEEEEMRKMEQKEAEDRKRQAEEEKKRQEDEEKKRLEAERNAIPAGIARLSQIKEKGECPSHFKMLNTKCWPPGKVPAKRPPRPKKLIHPFFPDRSKPITGSEMRFIVQRWSKMWDSALSDIRYQRIIFESNPDAQQIFATDEERINDGCQKLCAIARMNQNITSMMMKKFVSGPANRMYNLNRIEAAHCWDRIIDDTGLIRPKCCVDLPINKRPKLNVLSCRKPLLFKKCPDYFKMKAETLKLPSVNSTGSHTLKAKFKKTCIAPQRETKFNRNPAYWLDPNLVPPVPAGFREEEFHLDPQKDPTGEIRRDLAKAKTVAMRYTRFAHIIERAVRVIPNVEKVDKIMNEYFVADDPDIRRQTMLHNFFSSSKMETSPAFKKDAIYATILSRDHNPKHGKEKKQFPYILAEMSKTKVKQRQ